MLRYFFKIVNLGMKCAYVNFESVKTFWYNFRLKKMFVLKIKLINEKWSLCGN